VQRQYSGTAGRIENCQIGVFLAYGSSTGRAFLDRELYLPKEWLTDPARCQEAGIPEGMVFASKPQLAIQMLVRARAAGVPAAWVGADEVYGNDEPFRRHLEAAEQPYVLAVSSSHLVWQNMAQQSVGAITAELPPDAWTTCSAGAGRKCGVSCWRRSGRRVNGGSTSGGQPFGDSTRLWRGGAMPGHGSGPRERSWPGPESSR
jgi:SRSO17 transposase